MKDFAQYTATTQKWTVVVRQPLSVTSLKDRKFFLWAEPQAMYLVGHLVWKKIYTDS